MLAIRVGTQSEAFRGHIRCCESWVEYVEFGWVVNVSVQCTYFGSVGVYRVGMFAGLGYTSAGGGFVISTEQSWACRQAMGADSRWFRGKGPNEERMVCIDMVWYADIIHVYACDNRGGSVVGKYNIRVQRGRSFRETVLECD